MERPLWRDLRHRRAERRRAERLRASGQPPTPRVHYGLAILSAIGAIIAFSVGTAVDKSDLHRVRGHPAGFAVLVASAVVFALLGTYAVRRFATQVGRLISAQGGRATGAAIRLLSTLTGLVIVLVMTLGLIGVPLSRLLLGGAITGVIVGIAAQQSLGNVFAGLVLIIARPFTVGNYVRIRAGALGGIIEGEVLSIGLTYVVVDMEDGHLYVPNLGMLAAAVVRIPEPSRPTPELYVDRSLPKRPPRHAGAAPRRAQPSPRHTRLPRDIIRLMRERRDADHGHLAAPPEQPGEPGAAGSPRTSPAGDPDGAAPEDGGTEAPRSS